MNGRAFKKYKAKRKTYPFPVLYLSKDEVGENTVPVSLHLYGLEKSKGQYNPQRTF